MKGKEVKEKATFGDSLPVSPALKGKVDLERRICVGRKSQLCHSEWIHQDVDVKSGCVAISTFLFKKGPVFEGVGSALSQKQKG